LAEGVWITIGIPAWAAAALVGIGDAWPGARLPQRTLLWVEAQTHRGPAVRAITANHHDEDKDDGEHDDQSRRCDENRLIIDE
jgi:hypothetical protein